MRTSTKYNNVYNRTNSKGYIGIVVVNKIKVTASGETAISCARRLNYRCRESGIPIPNKQVGFDDFKYGKIFKSGYKHVWQIKNGSFKGYLRSNGIEMNAAGKTALQCAQRLNYRCRENGIPIPNKKVGFDDFKYGKVFKSGYKHVWQIKNGTFRGNFRSNGIQVQATEKTALQCARRLNYLCRKHRFPIPNPGIGFDSYKAKKPASKKKRSRKLPSRRGRRVVVKKEKESTNIVSADEEKDGKKFRVMQIGCSENMADGTVLDLELTEKEIKFLQKTLHKYRRKSEE